MKSQGNKVGKRAIVALLGTLILLSIVSLPFALQDVAVDLLNQSYPVYSISEPSEDLKIDHVDAHLDLVEINEWAGVAKLRVSAHDSCTEDCPWKDKITFVSLQNNFNKTRNISPSTSIEFPAAFRDVTEQIELPIYGDPIRYPFDEYEMNIGIFFERLYDNGRSEVLKSIPGHLETRLSLQARVPRLVMGKPVIEYNVRKEVYGSLKEEYEYNTQLSFTRPSYMKILTLLLIFLVTSASAYAVFWGPIHDLLLNSGALVLGVWGIRAILLGDNNPGITIADLVLSLIVLFLLMAITVRGFSLLGVNLRNFLSLRRKKQ